jgi:hypothetical protein
MLTSSTSCFGINSAWFSPTLAQSHKSKAIIHTWLAWQERLGIQLGKAITYRFIKSQQYILDDGKASDFINWLQALFKE